MALKKIAQVDANCVDVPLRYVFYNCLRQTWGGKSRMVEKLTTIHADIEGELGQPLSTFACKLLATTMTTRSKSG